MGLFSTSYSNKYIVISHCHLNFHYLDTRADYLSCHPYIFFGEVFMQISCLLLNLDYHLYYCI